MVPPKSLLSSSRGQTDARRNLSNTTEGEERQHDKVAVGDRRQHIRLMDGVGDGGGSLCRGAPVDVFSKHSHQPEDRLETLLPY